MKEHELLEEKCKWILQSYFSPDLHEKVIDYIQERSQKLPYLSQKHLSYDQEDGDSSLDEDFNWE